MTPADSVTDAIGLAVTAVMVLAVILMSYKETSNG